VGTAALKWAFIEWLIPIDPTEGLTTFTGEGKSRDILAEEGIEAPLDPTAEAVLTLLLLAQHGRSLNRGNKAPFHMSHRQERFQGFLSDRV
jgi:hypothetical protein